MNPRVIIESTERKIAIRITLSGRVQGIGLRPAVARRARELRLAGSICNTTEGIELQIEGPEKVVEEFERDLENYLPDETIIHQKTRETTKNCGSERFDIIEKQTSGPLAARVPADIAVCQDCLAELADPADHRFGYAFLSCTRCGPRYSLLHSMPYERGQTGMSKYDLCSHCQREYDSPVDCRFHAQTIACPQCGPRVWCTSTTGETNDSDTEAIQSAARALQQGAIVGLKGLGGYQLLVDATSEAAVQMLREKKQRLGKPLAVMVTDLIAARKLAMMNDAEAETLASPAAPIVLLQAHENSPIAGNVNPGLNTVGVMLPTTPLHWLLLQQCDFPLVVTSANREGEPLFYQDRSHSEKINTLADCWLEHDRPIERPIDDSVVRWMAGRLVTIRLARGLAPLSLDLEHPQPAIALGGHQKAAVALNNGAQSVLAPHIGDLESLAVCERYEEQLESLQQLYAVSQADYICDEHPDYFTSNRASQPVSRVERVQHHHAHIVAGMLEQGWLDRQVLGVAFDGTGRGDDQTIWGGEFLLSTAAQYTRVGHLKPFLLPGGEAAVREPYRVAVSLMTETLGSEAALNTGIKTELVRPVLQIIKSKRLSPRTSSVGRLFDGVAALVLGVTHSEYEGQAAMLLEASCDLAEAGSYEMPLSQGAPFQLDWRPCIAAILRDRKAGVSTGVMAMRFHRGLARGTARLCRQFMPLSVVLGGGVFQNRCLVELLAEELRQNDQPLGLPGRIPPNDGGLAAGQLAVAIVRSKQKGAAPCV
ncbi:carbamoyltransferase HypF [Gimesia maris]|uniref:Carbamoyltransferase n=1 Tax=Gimesia maris TaxID=122 RepID=A0ABX5YKE3_9PLAN|nr:carbamoyltransferase HypF [Gimesia maris]EDL61117.1 hydrogenase maturation protein [Gimesia maris DSM 8797]QEG16018.1 Carbamoyltransferase HypF [Gimesia maris]QGQ30727.1 carbamoyltransferase HypF [Gimesia maris]